jgi:hypothetical protein
MSRTPFIAGNWKMHKTVAEAEQYIQALLPKVAAVDGVEIVVCPPFLALQALVDSARGSQVGIYAQTMHEADQGAFTGEVSAPMLSEIDVHGVILGHSERRSSSRSRRRWTRGSPRSCASARPRRSASEARPSASCATRCRKGWRRWRRSGCPTWSSPTSRCGRSGPA